MFFELGSIYKLILCIVNSKSDIQKLEGLPTLRLPSACEPSARAALLPAHIHPSQPRNRYRKGIPVPFSFTDVCPRL